MNIKEKEIAESCAVHCYQDMDHDQFIMLLTRMGFTPDISYPDIPSATRQVEYYVYEKPYQKVAIEIEKDTFIDLWYVRFTAEEFKPEMVVDYVQLSYGCGVDELSKKTICTASQELSEIKIISSDMQSYKILIPCSEDDIFKILIG